MKNHVLYSIEYQGRHFNDARHDPNSEKNLDEGFKYLGFFLKPDRYRKDDWGWLIKESRGKNIPLDEHTVV
jgi:hypothetical protein